MLDEALNGLLQVHWIAGGVALVVAPLAMAVRKGGRWHRRWGRTFVFAMLVVCITAVLVALPKGNALMALVAVFSFHLTAAGWRALYLKRLHKGQRPAAIDWVLHGTAGAFNFCLLLWGVGGIVLRHTKDPRHIIFAVFGTVGTVLVLRYARQFFKRRHDRHEWLYDHMSGMMAGYIATVSAFSAVNLSTLLPVVVAWLWPTLLGTPVIILLVRHYRQRYGHHRNPQDDFKVKLG